MGWKTWVGGFFILSLAGTLLSGMKKVSDDYEVGTQYKHFTDGSCRSSTREVCVTAEQAKYLCGKLAGTTKGSLDTGLNWAMVGERAATVFANNTPSWEAEWEGNKCAIRLSASGMYEGTSAQVQYTGKVVTFIISEEREALAHHFFGSLD
jgi:hypothetical protein